MKKIIRIEEADRKYMEREQELLRQLSHPNIVQFIGLSSHEGFLWLVSELCAGGNLKVKPPCRVLRVWHLLGIKPQCVFCFCLCPISHS